MQTENITNFKKQLPKELDWLQPWDVELVRVGNEGDGGYLIPPFVIDKSEALLSMGLGENWTFDEHWHQLKPNDPIHMYDGTVTKASLPEQAWQWPNRNLLAMYEQFFNCTPGVRHYHEMIGNGRTDTNLESCIRRLGVNNVFLKMDIEGGEYSLVDDLVRFKDNIVCMATEIHGVNTHREKFREFISKICNEYVIVHFHANVGVPPLGVEGLTDALEITFLRKDLCNARSRRSEVYLPGLDSGNHFGVFDIEYWFDNGKK